MEKRNNFWKRFLSIVLAVVFVVVSGREYRLTVPAAGFQGNGVGTSENPYQITSASQLKQIDDDLGACYILMNDIDLSGINWTPLASTTAFTGTLDGNGYVIKNMSISRDFDFNSSGAAEVNVGLFGYLSNATIKRLGLKDIDIRLNTTDYGGENPFFVYAAGLAGYISDTTISQSYVTGSIRNVAGSNNYVRAAGIGCYITQNSKVENCYADVSLDAEGNDINTMVGGICSWLTDSVIDKCYAAGTITAKNTSGYVYASGIAASGDSDKMGSVINSVSMIQDYVTNDQNTNHDDICPDFLYKNNNYTIQETAAQNNTCYKLAGWDANIWDVSGDTKPRLVVLGSKLGDSITWKIKDGVLYIDGTGEVDVQTFDSPEVSKKKGNNEYTLEANISEFAYKNITKVIIGEGITSLGESAFAGCMDLKEVELPTTLKSIGMWSFTFCLDLAKIDLPSGVNDIGFAAFDTCVDLTSINLPAGLTVINGDIFNGCSNLMEVDLPETIQIIDYRAFGHCSSLTEITLPEGVTSIKTGVFYGCTKLSKISLPASVNNIGPLAFRDCNSLKEINLPTSVTSIGEYAFTDCNSLTEISMPEGVESIGACMFKGCSSLESIALPNGMTSIGEQGFYGCSSLNAVEIPASVTEIGEDAFANCASDLTFYGESPSYAETYANEKGIKFVSTTPTPDPNRGTLGDDITWEIRDGVLYIDGTGEIDPDAYDTAFREKEFTKIIIGEGIEAVGMGAFRQCESVTEISFPKSLRTISTLAFTFCSNLKEVYLPEKLEYIGAGAFSKCSALSKVEIPETVTTIGNPAFEDCASDFTLYVETGSYAETYAEKNNIRFVASIGDNITWEIRDKVLYINGTGEMLDISTSSEDGSSSKSVFADKVFTKAVVGEGITKLGGYVFDKCSGLTDVLLPSSLEQIGVCAFNGCTGLTGITLPVNLRYIDHNAFSRCSNLTEIIFPSSLSIIGYGAFLDCIGLTEIALPDNLNSLGFEAFSGCSGLRHITLPDDLKIIESSTFANCKNLTEITLPSGLTSMGGGTFSNCVGLTEIVLPDSLSTLGVYVFSGCSNLSKITLPKNLNEIKKYAFEGCNSLGDIRLPESVSIIGEAAFMTCSSLKAVYISSNIQSISIEAFENCASDLTFYGESGSYAETYAKAHNINFIAIGTVPNDMTWEIKNQILIITGTGILNAWDNTGSATQSIFTGKNFTKVVLSEGIEEIGAYSFADCKNMTSIVFPSTLTVISTGAFMGCTNLKEMSSLNQTTLPNQLKAIGECAFYHCTSLTSLSMPNALTSIGESAFEGCTGLAEIGIQGTALDSIAQNTFKDCTSLEQMRLPSGIIEIGEGAFEGCGSLRDVEIPESIAENQIGEASFSGCSGDLTFYGVAGSGANLYAEAHQIPFEDGTIDGLSGSLGENIQWKIRKQRLTISGTGLLDARKNISPDTITSVFAGKHFTTAEIKEGITGWGTLSFADCTSLESIQLPNSLRYISEGAFRDCRSLTQISLPTEVTEIGEYAFRGCSSLKELEIPAGLTEIKNNMFYGCSGLKKMQLPKGITRIGNRAFESCSTMDMIDIPASITGIGDSVIADNAFENSSNGLTIRGELGSYAHKYAKDKGIHFVSNSGDDTKVKYEDLAYGFVNNKKSFYGDDEDHYYSLEYFTDMMSEAWTQIPDVKSRSSLIISCFLDNYKWDGCCYGMSATSGMFHNQNSGVTLGQYSSSGASKIRDITNVYEENNIGLRKLMERMQISQHDLPIQKCYDENSTETLSGSALNAAGKTPREALENLCIAVDQAESDGKLPLIFIYGKDRLHGHILLGYRMEDAGDKIWIYVYDCNDLNGEHFIEVEKDYSGWSYDYVDGKKTGSQLNECISYVPYDDYEREYTEWFNMKTSIGAIRYNVLLAFMDAYAVIDNQDEDEKIREKRRAVGNLLANYKDGELFRSDYSIKPDRAGEADTENSSSNAPTFLYVPKGSYTIVNENPDEELKAEYLSDKLGVSVTTTSEQAEMTVDEELELQSVSIDAKEGDSYEITMDVCGDTENQAVKLTGTGAGENISITQEDGGLVMQNLENAVLEVEGEKKEYATVTATVTSGGTMTYLDKTSVIKGENLIYGIQADSGYRISNVLVDGKSVGAVATYEFQQLSGEHTIHAIFAKMSSNRGPTVYAPSNSSSDSGDGESSADGYTGGGGIADGTVTDKKNTAPQSIPVQSRDTVQTAGTGKETGEKFSTGSGKTKLTYEVLSDSKDHPTVALKKIAKKASKVVIPAYVRDEDTGVLYKVTKIRKKAFLNRTSLQTVVIGSNIMIIGKKAFQGCGGLSDMTIYGCSLEKVGKKAFQGVQQDLLLKVEANSTGQYRKLKKMLKKAGIKSAKYRYRIKS